MRKCHVNTDGNSRVRNKPAQGPECRLWGLRVGSLARNNLRGIPAWSTSRISEPKCWTHAVIQADRLQGLMAVDKAGRGYRFWLATQETQIWGLRAV